MNIEEYTSVAQKLKLLNGCYIRPMTSGECARTIDTLCLDR